MTSKICFDDIEAELWRGGVRSLPEVRKILRMVKMVIAQSRQEASPEPVTPRVRLQPGESDPAVRTMRCAGPCGKVRKWTLFPFDKATRKHGTTCKPCLGIAVPEPAPVPDTEFTCTACGKSRHASHFSRRPDTPTGFAYKCKDCVNIRKPCAQCGRKTPRRELADGTCQSCRGA